MSPYNRPVSWVPPPPSVYIALGRADLIKPDEPVWIGIGSFTAARTLSMADRGNQRLRDLEMGYFRDSEDLKSRFSVAKCDRPRRSPKAYVVETWAEWKVDTWAQWKASAVKLRGQPMFPLIPILVVIVCLAGAFSGIVYTMERNRNTEVSPASSSVPSPSGVPVAPAPSTVDVLEQCFTGYKTGSPLEFDCGACSLHGLKTSSMEPEAIQAVVDMAQFCGLRAVFDAASKTGKAALMEKGWFTKDKSFCVWDGVACGRHGLIESLFLQSPAIPSTLPQGMEYLVGLHDLGILGDGSLPAGESSVLNSLTALENLTFGSTALAPLSGAPRTLSSLSLVGNTNMASASLDAVVASGVTLKTLWVERQPLSVQDLKSLSDAPHLQASLESLTLIANGFSGTQPEGFPLQLEALTSINVKANDNLKLLF